MRCEVGQLVIEAVDVSRRAHRMTADYGEGRIHSVFRRSFNVVRPPSDWLTVAIAPFPRVPDGIIVATSSMSDWDHVQLAPGAATAWSADFLAVPQAGLRIRLAPARVYDTRRRPAPRAENLDRFHSNLTVAWKTLADFGCEEGLGGARSLLHRPEPMILALVESCPMPLCRRAVPSILALRTGIRTNDTAAIQLGIGQLLGLGIGLTPSGDDFLGGLAIGLYLGGACEAANRFASLLREALRDKGRTTEVSARALRLTVDREISDVVHDAAFAVAALDESAVVRAVRDLISLGSTSGTETALGLCLGLELVEEVGRGLGGT